MSSCSLKVPSLQSDASDHVPNACSRLKGRENADWGPGALDAEAAHLSWIHRLTLLKRSVIRAHRGCVNTAVWTDDGRHIITGSDDQKIGIWDVSAKKLVKRWHSGHSGNVFSAKSLGPALTDDCKIASCAADGEVRLHVANAGQMRIRRLGTHFGRAHKIAIVPGSYNEFASAGEDGLIVLYDIRMPPGRVSRPLCTLREGNGNRLSINIVDYSPRTPTELLVGGDSSILRVFDVRHVRAPVAQYCPSHMRDDDEDQDHAVPGGTSSSTAAGTGDAAGSGGPSSGTTTGTKRRARPSPAHITGAQWSPDGTEIVATYNDEHIYLFRHVAVDGLQASAQVPWKSGSIQVQLGAPHNIRRFRGAGIFGARLGAGGRGNPFASDGDDDEDDDHGDAGSVEDVNEAGEDTHEHASPNDAPGGIGSPLLGATTARGSSIVGQKPLHPIPTGDSTSIISTVGAAGDGGVAAVAPARASPPGFVAMDPSSATSPRLSSAPFSLGAAMLSDTSTGLRQQTAEEFGTAPVDPHSVTAASIDGVEWILTEDEQTARVGGGITSSSTNPFANDTNSIPASEVLAPGSPPPATAAPESAKISAAVTMDHVPADACGAPESKGTYVQVFKGHRNSDTVKGVSFFGPRGQYIVSGCDTGHVFIWSKADARIHAMFKADQRGAVNCLSPHPHGLPMLLTSGLEHTAKVWGPSNHGVATEADGKQDGEGRVVTLDLDEVRRVTAANARGRERGSDMSFGLGRLGGFSAGALLRLMLMGVDVRIGDDDDDDDGDGDDDEEEEDDEEDADGGDDHDDEEEAGNATDRDTGRDDDDGESKQPDDTGTASGPGRDAQQTDPEAAATASVSQSTAAAPSSGSSGDDNGDTEQL